MLAAQTEETRLYRFAASPSVIVVLFDTLHDQALTFNRVGAFVEKAGAPHDRVLDDAALQRAITASGDSFDTYYLGHDYSVADLRRFFSYADQEHLVLRPAETWLRTRLSALRLMSDDGAGAVVSVPPIDARADLDLPGRRTILRHELSHGVYFTDRHYAAYVASFWWTVLTEAERQTIASFLERQGYDPANQDLMRNECQAYLAFTDDARYFSAAALGMPEQRLAELRRAFFKGLPSGWLASSGL